MRSKIIPPTSVRAGGGAGTIPPSGGGRRSHGVPMRTRIPHLPHLIRSAAPTAELVPDRALLTEFVAAKSGIAFELLVRRHGPAVWAVCRRHLANTHDAEDAFQATFLVLAKSARRIAQHASVGSWLYGVAYRVALKARRTAARRVRIETAVSPTDETVTVPVPFNDTSAAIHAELEQLPDRYRLPLLLCDLEGLSRKEASVQLGWSEGTLSGRLNRARKLLAGRLTTRGIAAAVLATVGAVGMAPSQATTAAAVGVGLSVVGTSSTAAPETVAALAHGAMRDMTQSFVLKVSASVLAASLLLGGGLFGLQFDGTPQATAAPVPKVEMAKVEDITDALAQLVAQSAVQRELKLSSDQRVRLIDGFDKLDEQFEKGALAGITDGTSNGPAVPQQPSFGSGPFGSDQFNGQAGDLGAPNTANRKKYTKSRRELVAGTLTKTQFVRLQQCEVQVLGIKALQLKRVIDELGLTDGQKKDVFIAIREVNSASTIGEQGFPLPGQARDLPQIPNPPPGVGAGPPEPAVNPEKKLDEIVKDFTASQQKKWKELTGEKVAFNCPRMADRCHALFAQLQLLSAGTGNAGTGDPLPPPSPPIAPPGAAQPLPPPANPPK